MCIARLSGSHTKRLQSIALYKDFAAARHARLVSILVDGLVRGYVIGSVLAFWAENALLTAFCVVQFMSGGQLLQVNRITPACR